MKLTPREICAVLAGATVLTGATGAAAGGFTAPTNETELRAACARHGRPLEREVAIPLEQILAVKNAHTLRALCDSLRPAFSSDAPEVAFADADHNGDLKLSRREISLVPRRVREIAVDFDGDGYVAFDEFQRAAGGYVLSGR